jgi:UDP-N-acetylglucosamine diphosphorylase / glucose-1-phosphate thymidylyltransferase / UDP-N-acetylgalactosamine diphosphorylase / glucosamine-1-phosphate N-acetyltransferase / galactosamine-1-phosphate N-acetyltransferase
MQAVILAAGRGSRMGSLTEKLPKPMLEVAGKTLLEHKFDALPENVDEIIVIIGYLGNTIRERYGDSHDGRKITYVEQENPVGGTADALWKAKDLLHDKFFVLNGDDLYSTEDLNACAAYDWAILVKRVSDAAGGAKVVMDIENKVIDIIEGKYHGGGGGVVNTNTYVLDTRIFNTKPVPKGEGSTELGLPQTVLAASREQDIPLNVVEAVGWIQIKNSDALARAEKALSGGKK